MSALAGQIAQVCHEANRAWQIVSGDPAVSPPWNDAPYAQRTSAIEGVACALDGATPEALHETWRKNREAAGWVHGEFKSESLRTHPCMVAYDELPERERAKDTLFLAIVNALKDYQA